MPTYVPKSLIGPAQAVTATPAYYTSPAATNGIARTISAAPNAAVNFRVSLGADAAGTRIIDQTIASGNLFMLNGWWVTVVNSANALGVISSNATGTQLIAHVAGYEYS